VQAIFAYLNSAGSLYTHALRKSLPNPETGMGDVAELFTPERIAVVGATDRKGSIGRAIMENLLADFEGETVPVNPNKETVFDRECYPDLASVPEAVDLAVVVVPASVAVDVVEEAGETGIRNVVVITAGFGETGTEGATRARRLEAVATEYDLNLVGPNSLGIMSTATGLNATFAPEIALAGNISLMSQSGAFVTAVLDWAHDEGIGFDDVVSLGNKAVLDEVDFVETWGNDPETDVILAYLEGIDDGRRFIDATREVIRETPVVVLKSGRTEAGKKAVSSHTGTLAGSERAYEAGLRQAGALRVHTVEELFDAAEMLAGQPLPEGDRVAVVTNAGGPGVMATDAIGDASLSLASFRGETLDALRERLPGEANVYNPIDVLGDAPVERFRTALDLALADPGVDAAVVLAAPTTVVDFEDLADAVVDLQAEYGTPIAACLMGGSRTHSADRRLGEAAIPSYFDPARAVRGLDALVRYRDIRSRTYEEPATFDVDRERARGVLGQATERGDSRLGLEAMDLLSAYGIPTPEGTIATTPADAVAAAQDIDDPVVMKIVSPDLLHKSDIGGVRVGVENEDVYDTFEDLLTRAHRYQPDATLLGVQVQELVDTERGVETIVGLNRDPQFGPLLLFGLGGIFVEVLEDTAVRVAAVSEREAGEMVEEIEAAPLLHGARGRQPVAVEGIAETLQRLSQLATDFPAILELDVNPLVATPDGVVAVDLRLTVDHDKL
jgi:acetyltransferase